jgi:hypothetical protein
MELGGHRHSSAALPPGKKPVPILHEAGFVPGLVWNGAGNVSPTGIRFPDRAARSESRTYYTHIKQEAKL